MYVATVAAAYNLSVHVLQGLCSIGNNYMAYFCQSIIPLFIGPIEALFVLMLLTFEGLCVDM